MTASLKKSIFIITGALFLMIDAFYNGFPIVYSDTSTYIASGLELETPFDRPITYGIFLRLCSLNGLSLWFVIFFQALILSYLIFQLVKLIVGEIFHLRVGLATIILLSVLTGASWTVSQVMPDIFTSIALLCFILILIERKSIRKNIGMYLLFFISVAMSMSHPLLFTILIIFVFVFRNFIFSSDDTLKRNQPLLSMFLLTIASIATMNSAMSKSKHVFFMGSMVENGILKKYLDENCEKSVYKLCAYKDSLPDNFNDFVWKENSPLYKTGGWKESKTEYNQIILGTITEPEFIKLHIIESLKATINQLFHFNIGDGNGSFLEGTLLYQRISKYFSHDLIKYSNSNQSQSKMNFINPVNLLYKFVIALSVLVLCYILFTKQLFNENIKIASIVFILIMILNAWDCGTFSMVTDRYQCRVIWLIPFITIICIWKLYSERGNRKMTINFTTK